MKYLIFFFALILFSCKQNILQERIVTPEITIKCDSMLADSNGNHIYSVYFKSNQEHELQGMNVRFFYDAAEYQNTVAFTNFDGTYHVPEFGIPTVMTAAPSSKILFGFEGAARFVNGSIQKSDCDSNCIVLNTTWKRLFDIVLNPINTTDTCYSIVLDKISNQYGGYLPGSDGITIQLQNWHNNVNEIVENYNWEQLSFIKGRYPYGKPNCK